MRTDDHRRVCSDKAALERCTRKDRCRWLGSGKAAGKCTNRRIEGQYPPIWAVDCAYRRLEVEGEE